MRVTKESKITIQIKDHEITLTEDEARALLTQLQSVMPVVYQYPTVTKPYKWEPWTITWSSDDVQEKPF